MSKILIVDVKNKITSITYFNNLLLKITILNGWVYRKNGSIIITIIEYIME